MGLKIRLLNKFHENKIWEQALFNVKSIVNIGTPESSPKRITNYPPTRNLQAFSQEISSGPDSPSELSRRSSLAPPGGGSGPMISITKAETPSTCDFPRRLSNQSIGPFAVPVSFFSGPSKSYLSDRRGSEFQRRLSSSSVGTLPIAAFGEGSEKTRRPSTHSLGVFPFENEAEEDSLNTGKYRRRSAHALGAPFLPDCKRRSSHGNILGNFGFGGDSAGGPPQRRPSFQALSESVDCKRRSSHGNILGNFGFGGDSAGGPPQRRPSFQALSESVMQLFSSGK